MAQCTELGWLAVASVATGSKVNATAATLHAMLSCTRVHEKEKSMKHSKSGKRFNVKNVVFWDIRTQFVLHRGHITSPLQSPAS
jgi:hypothetical protein